MPDLPAAGWRLRGTLLGADGAASADLYVDGTGRISPEPLPGAEDLVTEGWIVPGLVDAHCHIGLGPDGPVTDVLEECAAQARIDRDAGTLLIRDCGSPVDTSPLQERADLPEIIRAGRHLARPKRYIPGLAVELDDPRLLVDEVRTQAARGDGWVKLVGDWIDRGLGDGADLAPLWPDDVLADAIAAAHDAGARVTAHVFGTEALPGLIRAGIDCIEHGPGLTDDLIDEMASRGTALVPTLINVQTFPSIADRATKYPRYAGHMRDLHDHAWETVGKAIEAGVAVYAGTDAGGGIRHGRIADEIAELARAGHPDPIGAASWAARSWLGRPAGPAAGVSADLVVYDRDPRDDLGVLRHPSVVLIRGRRVSVGA